LQESGDITRLWGDLDYYLIFAETGDREGEAQPSGILIEEFVLHDDYTAAGIDCAEWIPAGGTWSSSPSLSRGIRTDASLRNRAVPVSRRDAGTAYTMLGGGELPDEARVRTYFQDRRPLPASAPLSLGPIHTPSDSGGTRLYRILFAKELDQRGLANLRRSWSLEPADDPADPQARVVGTATLTTGDHSFGWNLRRIGPGIAWCLDVTVHLGSGPASAIGTLLHQHRQLMREQGLIPVTIERFA
jgi:hypothetical protein